MFEKKLENLFNAKKTNNNSFINVGLEESSVVSSANGSKQYSTSGDDFVDQFTNMSMYKVERSYSDIDSDMRLLFSQDKLNAVKFILFLRTITRKVKTMDGSITDLVQKGSGLKHESISRMIWLNVNHPQIFWDNLDLFISLGSWKDIFEMLRFDIEYNGWENRVLEWDKLSDYILSGLLNSEQSDLIKKYLPQIKAKSKCTTLESQANNIIAKFISNKMFGENSYQKYRLFKTSGKSHEWQKMISKKMFNQINFSSVHGRALMKLVQSKFIENQNLVDKYIDWLDKQPTVKFTGYVHELFKNFNNSTTIEKKHTIDKQFKNFVETSTEGDKKNSGLIVVRDTSGSMADIALGTNMSSFNIAKAMALYFSEMLPEGEFSDSFIEFNNSAKLHKWKGLTPTDKWLNDRTSTIGSTKFQSVINLFVEIKSKGISEDQFPKGILCISDFEFNPSELNNTNVERAYQKLRNVGFSENYVSNFKIILWNIPNGYYGKNEGVRFETFDNVQNVYYLSGYDGSILSFLTGKDNDSQSKESKEPKTASELFLSAMNQELLNKVKI